MTDKQRKALQDAVAAKKAEVSAQEDKALLKEAKKLGLDTAEYEKADDAKPKEETKEVKEVKKEDYSGIIGALKEAFGSGKEQSPKEDVLKTIE